MIPTEATHHARVVLRLASDTSLRFAILVLLLLGTAAEIYTVVLPPGSAVLLRTLSRCHLEARDLDARPDAAAAGRFETCMAPTYRHVSAATAVGLACVLIVAAVLLFGQPAWTLRRRHVVPLSTVDDATLPDRLAGLVAIAGLPTAPGFVVDLRETRPGGRAFGRWGRPHVLLGAGLIATRDTDPERFRTVVLHELAHVRNRDIGITYLTVALWRAFALTVIVPAVVEVIVPGILSGHPTGLLPSTGAIWFGVGQTVPLVILVYLTRNGVLRAREYQADLRASTWTARADLIAADTEPGRRWLEPLLVHPHPRNRLVALGEPRRTLHTSGWLLALTGIAIGLATNQLQVPLQLALTGHADAFDRLIEACFAIPAGLILAVVGWRAAVYRRLGGTRVTAYGTVTLGLIIGYRLDPVTSTSTLHLSWVGWARVTAYVLLAAALTLIGLWAAASARAWIGRPRSTRGATMTAAGAVVLTYVWAGWWGLTDWIDLLPDMVHAYGLKWTAISQVGWAPLGRVTVLFALGPIPVLQSFRILTQLGLVALWFVPLAAQWPGGGRNRRALPSILLVGVAAGLVIDATLRALARAFAAAAINATSFADVFLGTELVAVGIVAAIVAARARAFGPGLFAGYATGLAAMITAALVAGPSGCVALLAVANNSCALTPPDGYISALLTTAPLPITALAIVGAIVGGVRRTSLHAAEIRDRWQALPITAAVLAIVVVGWATVDAGARRDRKVVSIPLPTTVQSVDPREAGELMAAWIGVGGMSAISAVTKDIDQLQSARTGGDPSLLTAACQDLSADITTARALPEINDTQARDLFTRGMSRSEDLARSCSPSGSQDLDLARSDLQAASWRAIDVMCTAPQAREQEAIKQACADAYKPPR